MVGNSNGEETPKGGNLPKLDMKDIPFQVTPKTSHLHAVKRIFRYLKGKPKLGLWYPRVSSFDLEAYSDSDYAGANLDRKSTTGGCQFLGRRLISWQCKKQTIMATSTTEAEYVAAANCCGQVCFGKQSKDAQAAEILNLKTRIKNLEKKCKPSISHHKAWLRSVSRLSMKKKLGKKESVSKQGRKNTKSGPKLDDNTVDDLDADLDHGMDYMETEEAGNEGRQSNETEELNLDAEDKGSGEKGGSTISTVRPEVDAARPNIDTARLEVHTANAPVTTSIFDDEDITMAQTLEKMKEEKTKEKGVAFRDVKDSSRHVRSITKLKPLLSIDPKDKGKGILVEEEPVNIKRKDQGIDQIEKDEELAHKLHEEELAEIARI
ncbi:hypothetical protein Tco_0898004 [Tanacetum coccineum]